MMLKTVAGDAVEVADAVILAAAGHIYERRRKTHAGPPLHAYHCRWCNGEVRGRHGLEIHEHDCSQRPSGDLAEVTAEDMLALAWTPPFSS